MVDHSFFENYILLLEKFNLWDKYLSAGTLALPGKAHYGGIKLSYTIFSPTNSANPILVDMESDLDL